MKVLLVVGIIFRGFIKMHWFIDPWIFVVSNTIGKNRWEDCISLDSNLQGLIEPRNSRTLEPHD